MSPDHLGVGQRLPQNSTCASQQLVNMHFVMILWPKLNDKALSLSTYQHHSNAPSNQAKQPINEQNTVRCYDQARKPGSR